MKNCIDKKTLDIVVSTVQTTLDDVAAYFRLFGQAVMEASISYSTDKRTACDLIGVPLKNLRPLLREQFGEWSETSALEIDELCRIANTALAIVTKIKERGKL